MWEWHEAVVLGSARIFRGGSWIDVEGSVQIADDLLRVIVQLIDSETGFHVYSRSFDRPLEGFFDIRDEITELTVANVRVALPPETQLLPAVEYEESDLSAYVLYRRGKEIYEEPRTLDSIAEIIGYYEQALDIDPQYAAAHAGLCDAYVARYKLSNSTDEGLFIANKILAKHDENYMAPEVADSLARHVGEQTESGQDRSPECAVQ